MPDETVGALNSAASLRGQWRAWAPMRMRVAASRFRKRLPGLIPGWFAATFRAGIRLTQMLLPYRAGKQLVAVLIESLTADAVVVTRTKHATLKFYCPGAMPFKRSAPNDDDTLEWIRGFASDAVLWDIGANVGEYSLAAAARGLRVWAFEPAAVNYFVLAKNVEINRLDDRITALNVALHERTSIGALNMSRTQIGSSSHTYQDSEPGGDAGRYRQAVVGYSIDDFITAFAPPFPDHIKLDVDGNEALILSGARRTLADPRLQSLHSEVRPDSREQVLRMMREAGFASSRQLRIKPSGVADVLFTRT